MRADVALAINIARAIERKDRFGVRFRRALPAMAPKARAGREIVAMTRTSTVMSSKMMSDASVMMLVGRNTARSVARKREIPPPTERL